MTHQNRAPLLGRYWLAARLAVWVSALPFLLRVSSLHVLLGDMTTRAKRNPSKSTLDFESALAVVISVCQFRLFRFPFFPRACLRQSLAMYRVLTAMGYPVMIHFGVRKQGAAFVGHSWVTLNGRPLAERGSPEFTAVYSYPRSTDREN